MINNQNIIPQKNIVRRSQQLQTNLTIKVNEPYNQEYTLMKKSAINLSTNPHNISLPKTPYGNSQTSNNNNINLNHNRHQKVDQTPQQSIERSIQDINEKINKISHQIQKHDLQLMSITLKNVKQHQTSEKYKLQQFNNMKNNPSSEQITHLLSNYQKQILYLKKSLQTTIKNEDLKLFASETQRKINQILQPIKSSLFDHLSIFSQKLREQTFKKQQILKKQINQKIQYSNQVISKAFHKLQTFVHNISEKIELFHQKKSKKMSLSPVTVIKYIQNFQIPSQTNNLNILINQIVFQIDNEGYLLDHEGYYLLDHHNNQIKLDSKHIQILKHNNIIK